MKRYIYLGKQLNVENIFLNKNVVYFGEKIEKLREKYPKLEEILVCTEEINKIKKSEEYYESLT